MVLFTASAMNKEPIGDENESVKGSVQLQVAGAEHYLGNRMEQM